jgi:hypothetical protein
MWNSLSRPVIPKQQDGRTGVEDGIDAACKGKTVGGKQHTTSRWPVNVLGEGSEVWGQGRIDRKQC